MSRVTNSAFTRAMWSTRVTAPTKFDPSVRTLVRLDGHSPATAPQHGSPGKCSLCSSTRGGCHATPIPCSLAQASVRDIDTFAQAQIGPGRFASSHAIEVTPTEIEGMVLGFRVPAYLGKIRYRAGTSVDTNEPQDKG